MAKKYFWLKLKEDFFQSKRIKKMRKLPGGDTLMVIYLKMQLKAIKTDGIIEYTGIEPTIADEIALEIDEDVDSVRMCLTYLLSCGLAEESERGCFLPYSVENVGSEGDSAVRMRKSREKMKTLVVEDAAKPSLCDASVTNCDTEVAHRDTEIEIEIETDTEIEKDTLSCKQEEREPSPIIKGTTTKVTTTEMQAAVEAWNRLQDVGISPVTMIKSGSDRYKCLQARIREYGLDSVVAAFDRVRRSSFLRGGGKSGWVITFSWAVKPSNFQKLLDGEYDDREKGGTSGTDGGFKFYITDED